MTAPCRLSGAAEDDIDNILGFLHDRMLRGRALRRMLTADDQEPG